MCINPEGGGAPYLSRNLLREGGREQKDFDYSLSKFSLYIFYKRYLIDIRRIAANREDDPQKTERSLSQDIIERPNQKHREKLTYFHSE